MERLTERKRNSVIYSDFNRNSTDSCYEMMNNCLHKLADYEDAEEKGLLLRLPTEAYFIKDNIVRKGWVQELVYSPCRKLLLDVRYDDKTLDSYRGYVGNTVFLAKEEAEQKLKEMESD